MPPLSYPTSKGGVPVVFGAAKMMILVFRLMTCAGKRDHQREDWLLLDIIFLKPVTSLQLIKETIQNYFNRLVRNIFLKVRCDRQKRWYDRINKHKLPAAALTQIFFYNLFILLCKRLLSFYFEPRFCLTCPNFHLCLPRCQDDGIKVGSTFYHFTIITLFTLTVHSVSL